jgi:hypothetical protein
MRIDGEPACLIWARRGQCGLTWVKAARVAGRGLRGLAQRWRVQLYMAGSATKR